MKIQRVIEFDSVDKLNEWLLSHSVDNLTTIKKIFRSPDKVYFVWYEKQTITTS